MYPNFHLVLITAFTIILGLTININNNLYIFCQGCYDPLGAKQ